VTGALLITWGLAAMQGRVSVHLGPQRLWFVVFPFLAALGWAGLQTWAILPVGWHHPLWQEVDRVLGSGVGRPLIAGSVSIDPEMTFNAILRLLTYGGVFLLAAQLGRNRDRARAGLLAVILAQLGYAVYGLGVHFSGTERILWFAKWAYIGDLTSTFVNRNAYAAYAGMGMVCCVGLFTNALRHLSPRRGRMFDMAETILIRAVPYLMAAMVIGVALLLSRSRAASVATGVALLVMIICALFAHLVRLRAAAVIALAVLAIGFSSLLLGGEGVAQRFGDGVTDRTREDIYRLGWAAIHDAPMTGHGFGAFEPAFRIYRDSSLTGDSIIDLAHNVHLEMVMDLGLLGAGLLYLSFAAILVVCAWGLRSRQRDQIYPVVALSCAVLIMAHGFVDFSAQMPAVAITLAFLLGIGYAQSWPSRSTSTPAEKVNASISPVPVA
jgi:O-antigen ligase